MNNDPAPSQTPAGVEKFQPEASLPINHYRVFLHRDFFFQREASRLQLIVILLAVGQLKQGQLHQPNQLHRLHQLLHPHHLYKLQQLHQLLQTTSYTSNTIYIRHTTCKSYITYKGYISYIKYTIYTICTSISYST